MSKILYPPVVNYGILFQRPQQIFRALARAGHTSYFMNFQPGIDGQTVIRAPFQVERNMWLYPENYPAQTLDADVYYLSYPPYYMYGKSLNIPNMVFDAIDAPVEDFQSWWKDYLVSLNDADFVMAVSINLLEMVEEFIDHAEYVPNGVEYEHFQQKTKNPFTENSPIIGFSGAVAPWVDVNLMIKSAEAYPEYHFAILGIGYERQIHKLGLPKNMKFYGHKPYRKLPQWVNNFDVCTIPFKDTLVTQAANPIKFWEYLASGNPVVTTNLKETHFSEVYWAQSDEEYIEMIGKAVDEKRKGNKGMEKRKALAKSHDWNELIKPLLKYLEAI